MAILPALPWVKWTAVAIAGLLVATGAYTGKPVFFVALVLPLLVLLSAFQSEPHIRAASEAIRSGKRSEGAVEIQIECPLEEDRFYAVVATGSDCTWRFEFIPVGWTPTAGVFQAALYALPHVAWPALIEIEGRHIHPRYDPKKLPH